MKFANEVGHYETAFEDLGAIAGQLDGAYLSHWRQSTSAPTVVDLDQMRHR
jgi:hypothetical protein